MWLFILAASIAFLAGEPCSHAAILPFPVHAEICVADFLENVSIADSAMQIDRSLPLLNRFDLISLKRSRPPFFHLRFLADHPFRRSGMIHHIATVIILNITSHGIVHNVEARNPCTIIYGCLSHVLNGDLNKRLNAFREFRNVVRPYDEVAAQLLLGSIFSDRGLIPRETGSGYSGNSRYETPPNVAYSSQCFFLWSELGQWLTGCGCACSLPEPMDCALACWRSV